MTKRAGPSGNRLDEFDAATVKGMLLRGDRQHDIAAWFGVNGGRIAEIAAGRRFAGIDPAPENALPPPGPYPKTPEAVAAVKALASAREVLLSAAQMMRDQIA